MVFAILGTFDSPEKRHEIAFVQLPVRVAKNDSLSRSVNLEKAEQKCCSPADMFQIQM